jgi:hypothetical protein
MPNLDLQHKTFQVPEELVPFTNNSSLSYSNMKKIKSELDNNLGRSSDDDEVLKWIDKSLGTAIRAVDMPKRVRMNVGAEGTKDSITGERNNFKVGKVRDNGNANPTGVRLPKVATSSREIANDVTTYEEYNREINNILYLMEYMNNKTKKQ